MKRTDLARLFRKGWYNLTDIPSVQGSRSWKECQHDFDREPCRAPYTVSEFQMASSGWVATYEIFLIQETGSELISKRTIFPQARSVELCLRQSLRFTPVGCWKCSFPLTIAPGLGHFSILNMVHKVNDDTNACVSAEIPTGFNSRLERSWQREAQRALNYSYALFWSPSSRFLAFVDSDSSDSRTWSESDGPVCVAVFAIASDWLEDRDLLTLIKYTSMSDIIGGAVTNSQFHPIDSCLLFTLGKCIFVWRFEGMYISLETWSKAPVTEIMLVAEQLLPILIEEVPALQTKENTVSFSHCGTAIAIVYAGRPWPQLLALPPVRRELLHTQSSVGKRGSSDIGNVSPPTKRPRVLQPRDLKPNAERSVAMALKQLPSVLSTASMVALPDDQGLGAQGNVAIVNSKKRLHQISVIYGNEHSANELAICKLPNYIPLESGSVDIAIRPSSYDTGHSVCTTVVSSKPGSAYESDERGAAENLPVVIWKDTRALSVKPWSDHLIDTKESRHGGNGNSVVAYQQSTLAPL